MSEEEFSVGQEIHIKLANGSTMKGHVVKVRKKPKAKKYKFELSLFFPDIPFSNEDVKDSPYIFYFDEDE